MERKVEKKLRFQIHFSSKIHNYHFFLKKKPSVSSDDLSQKRSITTPWNTFEVFRSLCTQLVIICWANNLRMIGIALYHIRKVSLLPEYLIDCVRRCLKLSFKVRLVCQLKLLFRSVFEFAHAWQICGVMRNKRGWLSKFLECGCVAWTQSVIRQIFACTLTLALTLPLVGHRIRRRWK